MEIPSAVRLTPRQGECLDLYCAGNNQSQIAVMLEVKTQTVHKCLKIAFVKIHEATMGEPLKVGVVTNKMLRQRVTVYHKPTSTGARLAAFDLKHGCCSVTRPAQTTI